MFEIMMKIQPLVEILSYLVLGLVITATALARLTPSPKDDEAVGKIKAMVLLALKFLPTIGINPQTKKLEEATKEQAK